MILVQSESVSEGTFNVSNGGGPGVVLGHKLGMGLRQ